jgi:stage II sporulation SpoAA-like protein
VSTHTIDLLVEDGNDVTIVTLSGVADPSGIHALLTELDVMAQHGAALRLLLDETDLRAGLMGFGDIQDIVGDWRRSNALKSRRIAVVASNPLIRGLNQMFRLFANVENKGSVSAFSDRAAALAWLVRPLG